MGQAETRRYYVCSCSTQRVHFLYERDFPDERMKRRTQSLVPPTHEKNSKTVACTSPNDGSFSPPTLHPPHNRNQTYQCSDWIPVQLVNLHGAPGLLLLDSLRGKAPAERYRCHVDRLGRFDGQTAWPRVKVPALRNTTKDTPPARRERQGEKRSQRPRQKSLFFIFII